VRGRRGEGELEREKGREEGERETENKEGRQMEGEKTEDEKNVGRATNKKLALYKHV